LAERFCPAFAHEEVGAGSPLWEESMERFAAKSNGTRTRCRQLFSAAALSLLIMAVPVYAASPWENAVTVLQNAFTTTIARGLSLVAIVVGGLMFAFGEGESKRMLAGIIFGIGMAIGAVNFMAWLFP
jgi:type IV secretory pathway VirB2 component (pilin)